MPRGSVRFHRPLLVNQQASYQDGAPQDSETLSAFFSGHWNVATMKVAPGQLEPFLVHLPSAPLPLIGSCRFCLLGPVPPISSSWPQLGQVDIDPMNSYFPETSLEDLGILVLGLGVCLVLRARNVPLWGHSRQDRSSCPVLLKHFSGR